MYFNNVIFLTFQALFIRSFILVATAKAILIKRENYEFFQTNLSPQSQLPVKQDFAELCSQDALPHETKKVPLEFNDRFTNPYLSKADLAVL